MKVSQLLDRGRNVIVVYPEITVTNSRGDEVKVPSPTGIPVKVSMSKDRNASAELPGQVDVKVIRCAARTIPAGAWSRVTYGGEEWDLTAPPHISNGTSKATSNATFILRSRNSVVAE